MNIAMLSIHSCPLGRLGGENTGGMSIYIREVARELGRRGHFVDVYTRIHEPIHEDDMELGQNARLFHLRAGGEETEKPAIYDYLDDFVHDLEDQRSRNGIRYDLIHSHYWLSGVAGTMLQRSWEVPHIISFHTLGAVKNALGIGENEPPLRILSERNLVRNCQRIIVFTKEGKTDLVRYYDAVSEAVSVIPCGVNLDLFQPVARDLAKSHLGLGEEKIILSVGRLIPLKGVENLLKAVADLNEGLRSRVLVIGGTEDDGTEMLRLKNLAGSLAIEERISFLGSVDHETLPFYYSAANLCVVPSYHESFGLVILESLACGTPVIATKVGIAEGAIRDGETGYIIASNDPRTLADSIALLLSTARGDNESARSIRASVAAYSWSNITEAIIETYRSVLKDFLPSRKQTTSEGRA